jgi:hypothetical protein
VAATAPPRRGRARALGPPGVLGAVAGLAALLGLGWAGLRARQAPFPPPAAGSAPRGATPLPAGLPPPVARHLLAVFGAPGGGGSPVPVLHQHELGEAVRGGGGHRGPAAGAVEPVGPLVGREALQPEGGMPPEEDGLDGPQQGRAAPAALPGRVDQQQLNRESLVDRTYASGVGRVILGVPLQMRSTARCATPCSRVGPSATATPTRAPAASRHQVDPAGRRTAR